MYSMQGIEFISGRKLYLKKQFMKFTNRMMANDRKVGHLNFREQKGEFSITATDGNARLVARRRFTSQDELAGFVIGVNSTGPAVTAEILSEKNN